MMISFYQTGAAFSTFFYFRSLFILFFAFASQLVLPDCLNESAGRNDVLNEFRKRLRLEAFSGREICLLYTSLCAVCCGRAARKRNG